MKKALNLLLAYFLFLLFGILALTVFNVLNMSIQSFVAGREIKFFTETRFVKAFFDACFTAIFVICPCISYYRIRHQGGVLQAVSYVLICALTWALLFPGVDALEKRYSARHYMQSEYSQLSAGYFRNTGDRVYYFKNEFSELPNGSYEANAVVIDLSDNGKVSSRPIVNSPYFELNRAGKPFTDPLIKQNFESEVGGAFSFSFKNLISLGRNALEKGLTFYLGFASVALVLCCLYAMTGFFEWKLLNSCFLIVASTLCYFINMSGFEFFPSSVKSAMNSNSFVRILEHYFDSPVLTALNVFVSILFVIMGLIKLLVKNHKARK